MMKEKLLFLAFVILFGCPGFGRELEKEIGWIRVVRVHGKLSCSFVSEVTVSNSGYHWYKVKNKFSVFEAGSGRIKFVAYEKKEEKLAVESFCKE